MHNVLFVAQNQATHNVWFRRTKLAIHEPKPGYAQNETGPCTKRNRAMHNLKHNKFSQIHNFTAITFITFHSPSKRTKLGTALSAQVYAGQQSLDRNRTAAGVGHKAVTSSDLPVELTGTIQNNPGFCSTTVQHQDEEHRRETSSLNLAWPQIISSLCLAT